MGDVSEPILESYRRAREENDYPAQTGILVSLLRMLLHGDPSTLPVAQNTTMAILRMQSES